MLRSPHSGLIMTTLMIGVFSHAAHGQSRSFSSMLPESTAIYLEIAAADQLLDHPLRTKIQSSDAFQKIWRRPDVLKMRGGLTLVEMTLGDNVENFVRKLNNGGLAVAFDRDRKGLILIARTESRKWLDEYMDRLIQFARENAKKNGKSNPVKERSYRDVMVYQVDQLIVASFDEYLVVTNNSELGRTTVDRYLDNSKGGLVDSPHFQEVSAARKAKSDQVDVPREIAWSYLDVQMLRDASMAKELLSGKSKDLSAELIFGGLLSTLHHTPAITGSLTLTPQAAALTFSSPHKTDWAGEEREYVFGPNGKGQALPTLTTSGTLASLSTFRDLSKLWLRAGDLFGERVNDQLAKADSTLTTLFSGRDFGKDIMGAVHPELRLVVAHQEFSSERPIPAVRLPSFAIVGQLRDPSMMKVELRRIFQSLIGFLNVTGAMEGRPQLDLGTEAVGDVQLTTAEYVPETDRKATQEVPIYFNFSPSIAFVTDTVIVSSTIGFSKELAKQVQGSSNPPAKTSNETGTNTLLEIDAKSLVRALDDNRNQIVSQNILKKGQTKQEAEAEFQTLLSVLTLFKSARVQLDFNEQASLRANLHFAE